MQQENLDKLARLHFEDEKDIIKICDAYTGKEKQEEDGK